MHRCYCGTSAAQISYSVSDLLLSVNRLTTQSSDYVKFHLFWNLSMRTVGYNQSYMLSVTGAFCITVSIQFPFLLTSYFYSHFYSDLCLLHIFLGAALKKQWLILAFPH